MNTNENLIHEEGNMRFWTAETEFVRANNKNYMFHDEDDNLMIKVIFPSDSGAKELMWVMVHPVAGNVNEGIGRLCNDPTNCSQVEFGNIIYFEGGDDSTVPHCVGVLKREDNE
ncbi:MAG: hypothetical protein Unbinned4098contig1000_22 [Prokaryotic dsDNA virus sp.]|nr:MAG: hypothetical protein Unbinned4098contig1000_22 [Prokaryotic dsDNA virus sp.]|tara:strand:- start:3628 stop:3969 length:342 start_codon:yes stop_codon:yes gene_type:complete